MPKYINELRRAAFNDYRGHKSRVCELFLSFVGFGHSSYMHMPLPRINRAAYYARDILKKYDKGKIEIPEDSATRLTDAIHNWYSIFKPNRKVACCAFKVAKFTIGLHNREKSAQG